MVSSAVLRPSSASRWRAGVLFVSLLAIYNSNGREVGGYDSQPAKFASRALAVHATMTLDRDVERVPQFAERSAFALDRNGHYRSAYSPVPIVFGGAAGWLLANVLRVDLEAPLAPNLIAVLTASILTASAVTLVFLTLQRISPPSSAFWVAAALGLGTNLWGSVSRTLGQQESVVFGVALALFAWTRPSAEITRAQCWWGAVGLAIASTARLQTTPMAAILAIGLLQRAGWRAAFAPVAFIGASVLALLGAQQYWFGSPLGAVPALESLHPAIHAVSGSVSATPWIGAAGLLFSPNRGLFVFSPVALVPIAGLRRSVVALRDHGIAWLVTAAAVQFVVYATYSVWWGGHTFGPRYLLDAIVLLTPSGAVALDAIFNRPWQRTLCAVLLAWSVAVAGTGAFLADRWNTDPVDVDRNHERLWDWRDPQIVRAWRTGSSPQNFGLFTWASVRQAR